MLAFSGRWSSKDAADHPAGAQNSPNPRPDPPENYLAPNVGGVKVAKP